MIDTVPVDGPAMIDAVPVMGAAVVAVMPVLNLPSLNAAGLFEYQR
jgi:hypothetical protein